MHRADQLVEEGCWLSMFYEEEGRLRRAVRRRVRFCVAKAERMRIQRSDKMFAAGEKMIN